MTTTVGNGDPFFNSAIDISKEALEVANLWQQKYKEEKDKLKNAEDFIKILMQQLEQARKERDDVTQELTDVLIDFMNQKERH